MCVSPVLPALCMYVCACFGTSILSSPSGGSVRRLVLLAGDTKTLQPAPSSGWGESRGWGGWSEPACFPAFSWLRALLQGSVVGSESMLSPILSACCKKQWPEAGSVAEVAQVAQACTRLWGSSCSKCSLSPAGSLNLCNTSTSREGRCILMGPKSTSVGKETEGLTQGWNVND